MLDLKIHFLKTFSFIFSSPKYNYLLDALPLKTKLTHRLFCLWSQIVDSATLCGSTVFNIICYNVSGHRDLQRMWDFHFHMNTRCWALSLWYSLFYNISHSASRAFVAFPLSFGCETSTFNCSCYSKHPLISALNPVDLNLHGIPNTA